MDKAPLVFEKRLGGLMPVTPAAREAVAAIDGRVTVTLKRGGANQRRRAVYWIVTAIVADIMNDRCGLALTENDMHDIIRDKLKMYNNRELPSGDVHRKRWSTSNRDMSEPDRAEFTAKAFDIYSKWTGVPVETLLEEAQ